MSTREVTLRAFRIDSSPLMIEVSKDIFTAAKERLTNSLAQDRIMLLNQADESEEADLLSGFEIQKSHIFGTIMRIAPGVDAMQIDQNLLEKESFSVADVKRQTGKNSSAYRKHYYICFNDKFLVTTLPRPTTIIRAETYLNWLTQSHIYTFTAIVTPPPDLQLRDIKEIHIKSGIEDIPNSGSKNANFFERKLIELNKNILTSVKDLIFKDTSRLHDIDLERVISAELMLKIKKYKNSDEDIDKILGAILKPSDTSQLIFKDKKRNTIRASDIEKTELVTIETTEQGYWVEPSLHQKMANFLDQLAS